jgi:hypothetical protein
MQSLHSSSVNLRDKNCIATIHYQSWETITGVNKAIGMVCPDQVIVAVDYGDKYVLVKNDKRWLAKNRVSRCESQYMSVGFSNREQQTVLSTILHRPAGLLLSSAATVVAHRRISTGARFAGSPRGEV